MIKVVTSKRFIKALLINKKIISERKLTCNCAFLVFFLALSSPAWSHGAQKHIDRALRQYGKDVEKIVSHSQKIQDEVLGEVEDFLDHPERIETSASSRRMSSSQNESSSDEDAEEEGAALIHQQGCSSCKVKKIEMNPLLSSSLSSQLINNKISNSNNKTKKTDVRTHTTQLPPKIIIHDGEKSKNAKPSFFHQDSTQTLAFVSLSIPRIALQQLSQEAKKQNVRLILRGLHNNSFQETSKIFQDLGISADIDPTLFETFSITHVPTFVRFRIHNDAPVLQRHDRLSGNVPLSYALEKFNGEGEVRDAS